MFFFKDTVNITIIIPRQLPFCALTVSIVFILTVFSYGHQCIWSTVDMIYDYMMMTIHLVNDVFGVHPLSQHSFALKPHTQANIIKTSVILFWLPDMTIWCKHVHRLELREFSNFCAAHLPVRLDIETNFRYFLFLKWLSKIRNQEFRLYI